MPRSKLIHTDARYIIWLLDFLQSLGLDADTISANNGVDRAALPESNSLVSAALYRKLCGETSIARCQGDVAWRVWQIIVEDPAQPPSLNTVAEQLHCSGN